MARVTSRRAKRLAGLELTPEQEVEARRALGQGFPTDEPIRLEAFRTETARLDAMAVIRAWDAEHPLDSLRARRRLKTPDPVAAMAAVQEQRRRLAR